MFIVCVSYSLPSILARYQTMYQKQLHYTAMHDFIGSGRDVYSIYVTMDNQGGNKLLKIYL